MSSLKIRDIEVYVVDAEQNFVIVKISTDSDEVFGLGDATLNGREPAVAKYIETAFKPLLLGREVRNHSALWELLYKAAYWVPGSVAMSALAGVDMALWDIRGKMANQPVWQLLGGKFRDSVDVYTHISARTEEEVAQKVRRQTELGHRAIRVQGALSDDNATVTYGTTETLPVGHPLVESWDIEAYLERVPRMLGVARQEVGPSVRLLHDSHERLNVGDALRFAERIKAVDLFFWEDPFRPESALGNLRRLRSGYSSTPIAFGELFNRYDQVQPYLEERLIDFLRADLSHIGGITAAMKMAHMAQMRDVKTAWHGPPDLSAIGHAANIHVDMAVQNFGIQEWVPTVNEKTELLFGAIPQPEAGAVSLLDPEAPGLGVDFNVEAAKAHPYKQRFLPIAIERDGTIIDW